MLSLPIEEKAAALIVFITTLVQSEKCAMIIMLYPVID